MIGKANQYNDSVLLDDFKYNLGSRYQVAWDTLSSYVNTDELSSTTVAAQQYYYYPVGTQSVESVTITIGSVQYTLSPIYSQDQWNWFNALQVQPTSIPQLFFPRRDDFGIWPIPQDAYTITFQRFFRDRNLLVDDVTSGTVSVTQGSTTITGSSTTFSAAMAGRWFTITDTTAPGQGYWYRIASRTSDTSITLDTYYAGTTGSGLSYRIGETPELPEGAHHLFPYGTAADYYAGLRNNVENSKRFDNYFWTGSMSNISRDITDKNITGGLIGLQRKYKDRDREVIVERRPTLLSPTYKVFAETIS